MSRRDLSQLPRFYCGSGAPLPDTAFVALVPGEAAPLLPVSLPDGLKGAARRKVAALRLRDGAGLAASAAEVHPFLTDAKASSTWDRAVVAASEALAGWRAEVTGRPRARALALLPDYLDLPAAKDIATLQMRDDRVLVRLGLSDGFSAEPPLCEAILRRALAATSMRGAVWIGPPSPGIDAVLAAADVPVCTEAQGLKALGLAVPQAQPVMLDLLQDPGAEAQRLQQALRPWRLPAALACLAALTFGGHQAWLGQQAAQEARALRGETEAMLRSAILPTGPILDVRTQVSRALAAAQRPAATDSGPDPLRMFAATADALRAAPDGTEVQAVAFVAGAELAVDLTLASFAAADALLAQLRARGFTASLADASALDGEGVAARLMITGWEPDQ
ncbi:type II secretion system protein GspL [Pseudoruegeria sp. SHC-113]|uniref:type II secretion system protein GspL n=1 Tax=Pseudoruegeria sp. SHC-113 TaxID=2855439 RepID=UPI0021BA4D9E|nr:type II secretion system protein GspL [Pseudoruegeria sp. SHC-113]MCT8161670.1 hypothetical protein [Pseudoruegeria sp. SHC-113]